MLLAPFTLTNSSVDRRGKRSERAPMAATWLRVWAIGGMLAIMLFPSLRGGGMAGLSVPFWLLGAPLINLLWLERTRWKNTLQMWVRKRAISWRAQARVPSRLRSMRRRNSAMMRR